MNTTPAGEDQARTEAALWREHAPKWARSLNARAEIEQELLDAARGKRAMPTPEELRSWAVKLGVPAELREAAQIAAKAKETILASASIMGTVCFMRSDPGEQACNCCPKDSGHIFSRRVKFTHFDWPGTHRDVQEFLYLTALRDTSNEGKRVRVTVEVLDDDFA